MMFKEFFVHTKPGNQFKKCPILKTVKIITKILYERF